MKSSTDTKTTLPQRQNKSTELSKAPRRTQNTGYKDKGNEVRHNRFGRRYGSDSADNDTMLRMVLPGYNWFEDQLKKSIYNERKNQATPGGTVNSIVKLTDKTNPIPAEPKSSEPASEHKLSLTKLVINSTLMLLPNNSLPLKKRKIKEELEEINSETKCSSENLAQETKKLCSPPIQKVIPILNNSKPPIIIDLSKPEDEISPFNSPRPSAFKRRHTLKKTSNFQFLYQDTDGSHQDLEQPPIERKKTSCPVPAKRVKYQMPCNINSHVCELCCFAPPHNPSNMTKLQSQDYFKPIQTFSPKPALVPQKSYWTSNYLPTFNSYDPLAMPEIGRTFPEYHEPRQIFDNFESSLPPGHGYNMAAAKYWNKANTSSNEPVHMNSFRNQFRSIDNMPMSSPAFINEYKPVD